MIVRTVLGDIAPEALGRVLTHEHVYADPPPDVADADLRLDDETRAAAELAAFRAVGGGAVVDMTTVDYGRDVGALARIARAAGVHVVAATGFNKGRFAGRLTAGVATADLAARMIADVRADADGSAGRAGVIKAASGLDGPDADERRVFEAAAEAHAATGAPVSTHTEKGTWADGQVALLTGLGVAPDRILIGHLDLKPDLGYLRAIAETGVFLGFDQFTKAKYLADAARIALIGKLALEGHAGRILVSGDLARRSYLTAWGGGPGYPYFAGDLEQAFAAAGLPGEFHRRIVVDNPRRFLAFEPRP